MLFSIGTAFFIKNTCSPSLEIDPSHFHDFIPGLELRLRSRFYITMKICFPLKKVNRINLDLMLSLNDFLSYLLSQLQNLWRAGQIELKLIKELKDSFSER